MDGTFKAFVGSSETHAKYGTTSLVPTTLTSTRDELDNTLRVYSQAAKSSHNGANFLGLHLEGPYFALSQKGAQNPRYIKTPDKSEYSSIIESTNNIIRWSAAPELPGIPDFGKYLCENNILPSIAHTDAVYADVVKAYECGFTHMTHFYSAMSTVKRINSYRYAGVIESGYLIDDMTVEIIADGSHLPVSLLKLVYKIKGADSIALVTDSMRAAGMPEGKSILGSLKDGQEVIVEDGVAKLPDRSAFAGSVATFNQLVKNMIFMAEVPLLDAIKMASSTPARIIGCNTKGIIKKDYDADIVIFDNNIEIKYTIVGGNPVYQNMD